MAGDIRRGCTQSVRESEWKTNLCLMMPEKGCTSGLTYSVIPTSSSLAARLPMELARTLKSPVASSVKKVFMSELEGDDEEEGESEYESG
jgi:hypothetical protein